MPLTSDINLVSLLLAVGAGMISFASPCVLPLVPVYLSTIASQSVRTGANGSRPSVRQVIPSTLAFIAGLALVFTLLGASATGLGKAMAQYQNLLTRLAGVLVIVFGLHTSGILRIPALFQSRQLDLNRIHRPGVLGAGMMGGAFALGWVPCVGPFLAGVLAVASQEQSVAQGTLLLFCYSLGLGVPFLIVGLAFQPALGVVGWLRPRLHTLEIIGGIALTFLGVLLLTDQYSFMTGRLVEIFGIGFSA